MIIKDSLCFITKKSLTSEQSMFLKQIVFNCCLLIKKIKQQTLIIKKLKQRFLTIFNLK